MKTLLIIVSGLTYNSANNGKMNALKMTSQNDLDPYNLNKGHSNKDDSHSSCSEPSCMNKNQRSHSIASISTITNECNVADAFCLQNEGDKKIA